MLKRDNSTQNNETAKILVIDDHPLSRMSVIDLLSLDGYQILELDDNSKVIEFVLANYPDLIIIDSNIKGVNELEICKQLKENEAINEIPIILMTLDEDMRSHQKGFEAGADEIVTKPLETIAFSRRVKALIERKQLNESLNQIEQVLFAIARAIASRYRYEEDTGIRIGKLAEEFGKFLELRTKDINSLVYAANLHDIGTVAIPDAIMLKQGQLTQEEREIINQHVLVGETICQPLSSRRGILPIIRHHHERWDGSGYPDGLVGSQIPFLAQIFQIVDIYDALTSERAYKEAFTQEEALQILTEEAGKGWRNPELVQQFANFIQQHEH